jgi:Zinc dependent phospholipase C
MPTSATHITIVQRIADSAPQYRARLGDPDPTLPLTDPAAQRMRFASLGACGPDFLYLLMDYASDVQDLENILVKAAATFDSLGALMAGVQQYVDSTLSAVSNGLSDSIRDTSKLLSAVTQEGLFALLASGGFNPLAFFEARRQSDYPREEWFWADVLHYWRSGKFAENLVQDANQSGDPNLIAYALGYTTHYVTDVVGHPFVNQVVGGPWRLYWQRHHLVENFMDAYVWDRWHSPMPAPVVGEPPLDRLVPAPNPIGTGAPLSYSRLQDLVNIGAATKPDPVDKIVDDVAMQISSLLSDIGIAVNTEPEPPTDADAVAWSEMFARVIRRTYDGFSPVNLTKPYLLAGNVTSRTDGFPTALDVAAAYGAFRLILRVTTEERVVDPAPPDIASDISAAVAKIGADVAKDLGGIPPPPSIPIGGAFDPVAILQAIEQAADWAGKVAEATIQAAMDFVDDAIAAGATVATDGIKYALWVLAKALYGQYRTFRDVLTLRAYAAPFSDQILASFGNLPAASLWQSPGNPPPGTFPHEETTDQRAKVASRYVPTTVPVAPPELPSLDFVAPYMPSVAGATVPPDVFIDAPAGPDDMFDGTSGPQAEVDDAEKGPIAIRSDPKNFGGAIANSMRAIDAAVAGSPVYPDYNLDGDRGYAWPCWDVVDRPTRDAAGQITVPDPSTRT